MCTNLNCRETFTIKCTCIMQANQCTVKSYPCPFPYTESYVGMKHKIVILKKIVEGTSLDRYACNDFIYHYVTHTYIYNIIYNYCYE